MKKIFLIPSALVLALALSFLSGCVEGEGPTRPPANPNSLEATGAPIVLLDEGLGDVIAVDELRVGPNPNGYLTVQAGIRNRTDRDAEVQAQTIFYDGYGVVLNNEPGNETPWTNLQITANGTTSHRAQTLSKAAARSTIRIRFLHRPQP